MTTSDIQKFYENANIFITGGTGFLGRILIEKLLRSCPKVNKIYMLMREKKGKSLDVRLNELLNDVIFADLQTDYKTKIVPIPGDCANIKLGLSEFDRDILINEVTIVFHAAATVNFDEPLQNATFINIRGTREMLALCKEMKQLKFVAHVSTSYAHCTQPMLEEKFYKEPITPHQLITIAENVDANIIDTFSEQLIKPFPNSYTYTKSISEALIAQCDQLPIAVLRPSIIVSTYKEPIAGWINNFYGPQGVSTAGGLGILHSFHCDKKAGANVVPIDMCVNALIALPWHYRQQYDKVLQHNQISSESDKLKYETPIVHFESNSYRPIDWKTFRKLMEINGLQLPTVKAIGIYFLLLNKSLFVHRMSCFFFHILPAFIFDTILYCCGKKPMFMDIYKKVHKFSGVISYFSTRHWNFKSRNLLEIIDAMSPDDRQLFFCDLQQLKWEEFFKTYYRGCRIYLLKDPIDTIPEAEIKYRRLQIATYFVLAVITCLLCLFISFVYNQIGNLFSV